MFRPSHGATFEPAVAYDGVGTPVNTPLLSGSALPRIVESMVPGSGGEPNLGVTSKGTIVLTSSGCAQAADVYLPTQTLANAGTLRLEKGAGGERWIHGSIANSIVDANSLHEYKSEYGKTLVCAYASIGGRKVGVVANQRSRTKTRQGELQIGGVIYHDSADKAARFVMDCNQSGLPLVFFQDVA